MPVKPQPFKQVCKQCGYSKLVAPKSDCFRPGELLSACPVCQSELEKTELSWFEKQKVVFTRYI